MRVTLKSLRRHWCRITAAHWWEYFDAMCERQHKGYAGTWIETQGRRCKICEREEGLLPVTKWWEREVRQWRETR
jgi:hypothetical protein